MLNRQEKKLFFQLFIMLGFFKDYIFLVYVYECFACIYICAPVEYSVQGGQRRVSDSLELESEMAVSHHGG